MADKEINIKVTTEVDMSQLQELKEIIGELEGSAEELTEQLDEIDPNIDTTSVDELGDSLEESSESADELNDSLNEVDGSGLDDASSSADELANSLNDAASSADEVNNSLGAMEAVSYMGMAEGIGQYADGAENLAQEMNNAAISVGQLATNAGMAEGDMIALINHISNMTFPQEEAMAYVNALNQMGVSADKLGDSATNMDRINDATHIGYNNVIQLTQGLRAVGIEADNLPAAFNAIAFAQSNVTGGAATLSQVLKTQAATINEYGLNVDQLVLIMQKLSEQGVQGRKMGSELSKVLKENNGDLSAIEKQLNMTSGSLSNASAATAQYEGQLQSLANEEMDHKTFLDALNAAWEDFSLSLSPVISPLMSVVGLIGQFGQFALAINSIVTLAQTFGILTTATETATVAQMGLNLAFLTNPVFLVIAAITILIVILGYLYFNNEQVRAAVDGLGQALWNLGGTIYNALAGALDWLRGAWENTVNFFKEYGELFLEIMFVVMTGGVGAIFLLLANINGAPNKLGQILQNMINKVISFATGFITNIWNAGVNAVTRFINAIKRAPGQLVDELRKMINQALDFASKLPQILWEAGANAVKGFLSGLGRHSPGTMQTEMVNELSETADRIPSLIDNIGNALSLIGNKAEEFTSQVAGKMQNGMGSVQATMDTAYDWIGNGMAQMVTAMGGDGQAFLQVWSQMKTETVNAVTNMLNSIYSLPANIGKTFNDIIGRATSFTTNFVNKLVSAATNVVSRFTSIISNLSNGILREFNEIIRQATNFVGNIGSILYNAGANAVRMFLSGLQRNSPGKIQNEMLNELRETGEKIPSTSRLMIDNIGKTSENIVKSWGNPNLNISSTNNALLNNGNAVNQPASYTFNLYGDMDNEERMQKFIEAVRRELYWNNNTAGRTV